MNAKELQIELIRIGACPEAIAWCNGKSLAEAWSNCERADWMLRLLSKKIASPGWPDHKQVARLACLCAETALKFVPEGEERPRKAIDAASAAAAAAYAAAAAAADCAAYATATTATAAYAASAAADCAAYAAATASAYAASTAITAAYAAGAAGRGHALREMADMIRAEIPSLPLRETSMPL